MIGMIPALMLSELHGNVATGYSKGVYDLANRLGYNFKHVLPCTFERLAKFMQKDKKTMNGELHFALLQEIGDPFVQIISMDEVKKCDEQLRQWVKEGNE